MKHLLRATLKALLAVAALAAGSAFAVELPGPLVDTQWLNANLKDKDLVVLDVRVEKDRNAFGYVPGSRLWDWDTVRVDRVIGDVALDSMVPTKEQFEALMRAQNVTNADNVVIAPLSHNPSSLTMGTRAYWTLKYFGHDKVALLDGGVAKWTAEKRETTKAPEAPGKASAYKATAIRGDILALTPDVVAAVGNKNVQLVDGRTPEFYLGEKKKDYVSAKGHIPGAKLVSNSDLADTKTGAFKSLPELKELFAASGVDPAKPTITYCDSGHLSSGVWFIEHELLGNKNVKLYDGSMHEWTKDAKRPVTTAPQ